MNRALGTVLALLLVCLLLPTLARYAAQAVPLLVGLLVVLALVRTWLPKNRGGHR